MSQEEPTESLDDGTRRVSPDRSDERILRVSSTFTSRQNRRWSCQEIGGKEGKEGQHSLLFPNRLLLSGWASDYTVVVEDEIFHLHRPILVENSGLFRSAFRLKPSEKEYRFPEESLITANVFAEFVEQWYLGPHQRSWESTKSTPLADRLLHRFLEERVAGYLSTKELPPQPLRVWNDFLESAIMLPTARNNRPNYLRLKENREKISFCLAFDGEVVFDEESIFSDHTDNTSYLVWTESMSVDGLQRINSFFDRSTLAAFFKVYRFESFTLEHRYGGQWIRASLVDPTGKLPKIEYRSDKLVCSEELDSLRVNVYVQIEELLVLVARQQFLSSFQ